MMGGTNIILLSIIGVLVTVAAISTFWLHEALVGRRKDRHKWAEKYRQLKAQNSLLSMQNKKLHDKIIEVSFSFNEVLEQQVREEVKSVLDKIPTLTEIIEVPPLLTAEEKQNG